MLQIFQSNQLYAIFISLRFIISVLLISPYIKHLISDMSIIKIFSSTIHNYVIMALLVTFGAVSLGTNFCIKGYLSGILFLSLILISLACLVFVCANEICKIQISDIEKYKNKIKCIILEATTVLSILTILISSIIINYISNLKGDIKLLSTITFVFLSTKILGHYYTKMGDIISDFQEKIVKHNKEDSSLNDYSKIDNMGDIFGDCYGEIISFILISYFLFKLTVLKTQLIHIHGSYLDKSYIICIVIHIINNKNKSIKNIGLAVLSLILMLNIIDPIIKYLAYHGYHLIDVIRYTCYNFTTQLYIIIPTLIIIFSFRPLINFVANYLYIRSISIPICGLLENISISILISFIITTLSIISIKIANKYLSISHFALFEVFSICGCICLYNTIFATFADSINGIIKKRNILFEQSDNERDKITDEYLEELDNSGNVLKLEAKVLMNMFAQILILINSGIKSFQVRLNDLYLLLIFLTIFTTFSSIIYNFHLSDNKNKKYIYELPFYTFIVLITGHVGIKSVFGINKSYGISILMFLLSISNFANISGSLFDCIKKKAEINKDNKDIRSSTENYKIIVQNDILGDFLKDVLGPVLFGISVSCFIYL